MPKLVVYAPNIHTGGGAVVLNNLLESLSTWDIELIVDERFVLQDSLMSSFQLRRIKPSIRCRSLAEFYLPRWSANAAYVLCFGNLPPLRSLGVPTGVFLQNRYLLDGLSQGLPLPAFVRIRLTMEKIWLRLFSDNTDDVYVQTETMQGLVKEWLQRQSVVVDCIARPLSSIPETVSLHSKSNKPVTFLYPASGEAHKNHKNLFMAWALLSELSSPPVLYVTLPEGEFKQLHAEVKYLPSICNLGVVPFEQVQKHYHQVTALIFPSFFESLGLPLLEADMIGLPIIASEKDFVRDLIMPEQTFDPESAKSISRAVIRLLNLDTEYLKGSSTPFAHLLKHKIL